MENLGFSGDTVHINDNHVIKICNTNQLRFIKNLNKQKTFNNQYIKPIEIFESGINIYDKNYIKMPLLKCENPIIWLSKCNLNDVNQIINLFNNYFSDLIYRSEKKYFDYSIWINKIQELENKLTDYELKNILSLLKKITFTNDFYYGDYHGDLTLSNLFILEEKSEIVIYGIDFLESFIHSPINDLVKIRQDTKHLWTLYLTNSNFKIDKNKVIIILNHLDNQLEKFIKNDQILLEFYLPFQLINLMRIIPYSTDNNLSIYLKSEILEIFNEFNANYALCG